MLKQLTSPAMVVAIIALVLAIGGSAVAAGLQKNSVTSKSIKKNAVTGIKVKNSSLSGADVKNDSLGGADIDESTLKQVPSAATVGGIPASKIATDDTILKINAAMNRGDGARVLATIGAFTIVGSCYANGATTYDVRLEVTTSVNDAWGYFNGAADTSFDVGETKYLNNVAAATPTARNRANGSIDAFDPSTGIAVQGSLYGYYGFPGTNCRYVGVLTAERP